MHELPEADRSRLPNSVSYRVAATLAVLVVPDLLRFRAPFWTRDHAAQAPLFALAFVTASWLASIWGRGRVGRLVVAVGVLALSALIIGVVANAAPMVPVSRSAGLLAVLISALLIIVEELISSPRVLAWGAGGLALGCVALHALMIESGDDPLPPQRVITTLESIELVHHGLQVDPVDVHRGGALTRIGEHVVAMTGSGALYLVASGAAGGVIRGKRLPIATPVDFSLFDPSLVLPLGSETVRAQDLLVRAVANGWQLFVSHHAWDGVGRCVTLAVSTATLSSALDRVESDWRVVTRSQPCLPFGESPSGGNFAGHLSGGQMAWLRQDELLLTIGDHGHDAVGRPLAGAQLDQFDYGKIRRINVNTGRSFPYTKGNRNPQGLLITRDGQIWSTEHGPRGGDELNLIVEGGNYGWPYETFGTNYGELTWPPAETPHLDGGFTGPRHAWLPSVGITAIIQVASPLFRRWNGDLLAASLRGRALHRIHLEGDRVIFVEPIAVGEEIRDLVEGPDGSLWLWTDRATLLTLTPSRESRVALVVAECRNCHTIDRNSSVPLRGPNLSGVVNRKVASDPSFSAYTPALRAVGGRWTVDRVSAFLADPVAFAPGTAMSLRVSDKEVRDSVIAYLARH